ncbi:glycosyltransferase [Serpentinicella alkaliphila]|nr:glycosyltransferase [Serpentinicella alkaliphila]
MIYGLCGGGAERVLVNLANKLSENGNVVKIIVFDEGQSDYELQKGIDVVSYKTNTSNKLFTFFSMIINMRRAILDTNPDLLISFLTTTNIYALLGNLLHNKTIIISERNDPNQDPEQWYYRLLRKFIYPLASGFVFQTNDAKKYFSKNIQNRSTVIPNPVFIDLIDNFHIEKKNTIVCVGRLEPQKNQKMLIDAFEIIKDDFPDFSLDIYGDGSLRTELQEYINNKSLQNIVTLKGRVKNLHEQIIGASLFVLPSNYEGMSNALMEAMALGIPCISTDCPIGGSADLIKNNVNGILIAVNDVDQLICAMRKILGNKDFSTKLATEATKVKTTNNISNIYIEWDEYIKKVISNENK